MLIQTVTLMLLSTSTLLILVHKAVKCLRLVMLLVFIETVLVLVAALVNGDTIAILMKMFVAAG